jgi:hypothetical protein
VGVCSCIIHTHLPYISLLPVAVSLNRLVPPPSLAWHAFMHLRGKPDPFLVGCPYPKPPFLFHDETPARWRMPTGGAGEGANPQVRGYWGSGVHWEIPARGSGWLPPLGCSVLVRKAAIPGGLFYGTAGRTCGSSVMAETAFRHGTWTMNSYPQHPGAQCNWAQGGRGPLGEYGD